MVVLSASRTISRRPIGEKRGCLQYTSGRGLWVGQEDACSHLSIEFAGRYAGVHLRHLRALSEAGGIRSHPGNRGLPSARTCAEGNQKPRMGSVHEYLVTHTGIFGSFDVTPDQGEQ